MVASCRKDQRGMLLSHACLFFEPIFLSAKRGRDIRRSSYSKENKNEEKDNTPDSADFVSTYAHWHPFRMRGEEDSG